jgi:hypothetical protein
LGLSASMIYPPSGNDPSIEPHAFTRSANICSFWFVVSAKPLDCHLQNIQPALEPVDRVDNSVLVHIHVID